MQESFSVSNAVAGAQALFGVMTGYILSYIAPKMFRETHGKKVYAVRFIAALMICSGVFALAVM